MPDIYLIYCTLIFVSDLQECPIHYYNSDTMYHELESPLDYVPYHISFKEALCCNMTFH